VPEAVIQLRVLRASTRTDELLGDLARSLGRDSLEPDDTGLVLVRLDLRGPKAWDSVRDALDEAGPDWRQWLHLAPRPRA
jgi:hypothetical protein